jgi:hypothetical protein
VLADTGEFTARTQKRFEDTVLILDAVLEHGFASAAGRAAIRRMNQMHGAHPIPDADFVYVLSTFVVLPIRRIDRFGWRRLSETEKAAGARYNRELGGHMGIKDVPVTPREFAARLDAYEAERFARHPGGRAVADAALDLIATLPPVDRLPAALVRRFALGLMDDPLRTALGYPRLPPAEQLLYAAAVRLRGPRRTPAPAAHRTAVRPPATRNPRLPPRLRRRPAQHLPPPPTGGGPPHRRPRLTAADPPGRRFRRPHR